MTTFSKPLGAEDASAVEFVREMLAGDPTYAVNFDRIQWDSKNGRYAIIEFLLCDEKQFSRGITPHTSHPNRYFHLNSQKFISLWEIAEQLGADLYLVNYSKKGTKYQDEVKLMKVLAVNVDSAPHVQTDDRDLTRSQFSIWFRGFNQRGRRQ